MRRESFARGAPPPLRASRDRAGPKAACLSLSMSISPRTRASRMIGTTISDRVSRLHARYRGSAFTSSTMIVCLLGGGRAADAVAERDARVRRRLAEKRPEHAARRRRAGRCRPRCSRASRPSGSRRPPASPRVVRSRRLRIGRIADRLEHIARTVVDHSYVLFSRFPRQQHEPAENRRPSSASWRGCAARRTRRGADRRPASVTHRSADLRSAARRSAAAMTMPE